MSSLFDKLELEAFKAGVTPRTKESRDWFRRRVQSIRRVNRNDLMKSEQISLKNRFEPGKMVFFFYDPKLKKTLPYYDSFPLVVVIGPAEGGFLGLNLHYLPPILRAKMLDALLETNTDPKYTASAKFDITYSLLKRATKMKYYKPCVKHYLTDHVRSRFGFVAPTEWEIATFLPTADWQKQSGSKVYQDSRKMI